MKKQWKQGCDVVEHTAGSFGNGAPMFPAYSIEFRLTSGQMSTLQEILEGAFNDGKCSALVVDIRAFFNNALTNKGIK